MAGLPSPTVTSGTQGTIFLADRDIRVATAITWRLAINPTADKRDAHGERIPVFTLFFRATVPLYWQRQRPTRLRAILTPAHPTWRIGMRRRPPAPPAFTIDGMVHTVAPNQIVLSECTYL
jgi:hypothetical protein